MKHKCSCICCKKFHSYATYSLVVSASVNTLMWVNIEEKELIRVNCVLRLGVGFYNVLLKKKNSIPEMSC